MTVLVVLFVAMVLFGGGDVDSNVDGLLDGGDVCRTVSERVGGGVCGNGALRWRRF